MARLFGALANAGAQANTNRFKRQQYDDQQAAQLREEARRALEFKAMRDQAAAQMDLMRQSRQDMLDQRKQEEGRRRDEDIASGIRNGFESAPYEEASSAANAFLQSQGMGMPSQVVKAPRSTRKPIMVEGQDVGAPDLQASPEYTRIGGRLMRYDAQKQANAKAATGASDMMAKFALERVKSKGDIDEILARAGAAYHPPPQRRYGKYFTNPKTGQTTWVDEGMDPPPGSVMASGAGATKATTAATPGVNNPTTKTLYTNYRKEEPVKTAMAVAGPIRSINAALEQGISTGNRTAMLSAIYQVAKLNDPRTGVRPSELELVGETVGLDERLRRTISKWNSGKMLTPDMINDIQSFVAEQQSMASEAVKPTQALYGQMLRDSGLESDSAYVAPSPIQSRKPSPSAGGRKPFSQRLQEDGK